MSDDERIPRSDGIVTGCCIRWRLWIRPVVFVVYFIVILILLPLLILGLAKSELSIQKEVWIVGGLFVVLAVPISLWDITHHLVHFTKPHMQKYIIRILWMVPIYALNAFLGLTYPKYAIYVDSCRECYEAYVIYNFFHFLLTYLREEVSPVEEILNRDRYVRHIFPFCLLKPWAVGSELIHRCKHGILQYTIVRPLTSIISLVCELSGVYGEGKFLVNVAYPYIIALNNLSQFIAMYHLVFFYRAYREALGPMRPIGKFLCIKAVVFFSFFQGVIIAILVYTGVIPVWLSPDGQHDGAPQSIQNFLICIEMFLAAVAHHYSFSYRPYVDMAQEQHGCCFAFLHMWDVSDVRRDVAEHINVIGSTVRRGVGVRRPTFGFKTRNGRGSKGGDERQALLKGGEASPLHSPVAARSNGGASRDYQTISDSDHEGINAGLGALSGADRITVHVQVEQPSTVQDVSDFVDLDQEKSPSLA